MINEKLQYQRAIKKAKEAVFYAEMNDSIGGIHQIRETKETLRRLKKEYYELYGEDHNETI